MRIAIHVDDNFSGKRGCKVQQEYRSCELKTFFPVFGAREDDDVDVTVLFGIVIS